MIRSACLALAAVFALAAPGGAGGAPAHAQTLNASSALDVSDTRWSGSVAWEDDEMRDWTLHFRPDGVLVYAYDGQVWDNGRWTQNNHLLTFHTNTYFAQYSGLLDETGQMFEGVMFNQGGSLGMFNFQRDPLH